MKIFFSSKYPVAVGFKDGENVKVPAGTIFTIDSISGNSFNLIPIKKTPEITCPVMVDAGMLSLGFTQQETV